MNPIDFAWTGIRRRGSGAFAVGALVGSALMYFLDPRGGRRRRHVTRDRGFALLRRGARRAGRAGRAVGSEVYGAARKAQHLREEPKEFDDATLARKVESELFRPADAPKGRVDVNAQNGVIQLRGEVPRPELIEELVARVRRIQGVRDVENLLHLPNTPAPMHQ